MAASLWLKIVNIFMKEKPNTFLLHAYSMYRKKHFLNSSRLAHNTQRKEMNNNKKEPVEKLAKKGSLQGRGGHEKEQIKTLTEKKEEGVKGRNQQEKALYFLQVFLWVEFQ